jgi:hypothetical protein
LISQNILYYKHILQNEIMKKIFGYFDLRQRKKEGVLRNGVQDTNSSLRSFLYNFKKFITNTIVYHFVMYSAVFLGVLGKAFFDIKMGSKDISGFNLLISLIIAAVIFPKVSRESNINPENAHPMHFFLAFQGGFFWQSFLDTIGQAM